MNRNEFLEKWQERLLWLGMRGLALDQDERPRGPHGAGAYALALPARIQQMIMEMWQDAHPSPLPNGQLPAAKPESKVKR